MRGRNSGHSPTGWGRPIAKALLGKAVLPDDDPLVTGGVGYLGARPSQQVFAGCDTLLIVGLELSLHRVLP